MQELTDNLKNLLRQLKNDKTITKSSLESNLPIVLSETKLLEEKFISLETFAIKK